MIRYWHWVSESCNSGGLLQGVLINVVLCSVESGLGTGGVGSSEVTWGATNIGQNLGGCVAYYYYFRVGVGDNTNDGGWARMLTLTRMGRRWVSNYEGIHTDL